MAAHLRLLDLPDDLLLSIVDKLKFAERHRALPLVCRRLEAVLHHPSLLAALELNLDPDAGPAGGGFQLAEQRSASFFRWLQRRAAGGVRQLQLCVAWIKPWDGYTDTSRELHASLQASLAACHQLQRLDLRLFGSPLDLRGSLPASLQHLRVDTTYRRHWPTRVTLSPALTALTRLVELEVMGSAVALPPQPCFPSSLTALALERRSDPRGGSRQDGVLEQFGHLPRLRTLRLVRVRPSDEPGANLAQLTALTALELSLVALPRSLTALTALRSFHWSLQPGCAGSPLPPGPWLAGLQALVAPASCLCGPRHDVLAAAARLESLEVDAFRMPLEQALAVLRWAGQRPLLRALALRYLQGDLEDQVLEATAAARRTNPALRVTVTTEAAEWCIQRGELDLTDFEVE